MIYLFDYGYGASMVFVSSSISQEEIDFAVKVEEIPPEPEKIEGKIAILRCNHETKEVWYDFIEDKKREKENITEN